MADSKSKITVDEYIGEELTELKTAMDTFSGYNEKFIKGMRNCLDGFNSDFIENFRDALDAMKDTKSPELMKSIKALHGDTYKAIRNFIETDGEMAKKFEHLDKIS